jgi:hypothetical protein
MFAQCQYIPAGGHLIKNVGSERKFSQSLKQMQKMEKKQITAASEKVLLLVILIRAAIWFATAMQPEEVTSVPVDAAVSQFLSSHPAI